LGVWRGLKKKERSEKNGELWEGRALRDLVFFIIQNSPNLGELRNCIGGGFWRGLSKFSKSSIYCYNTRKLKVH